MYMYIYTYFYTAVWKKQTAPFLALIGFQKLEHSLKVKLTRCAHDIHTLRKPRNLVSYEKLPQQIVCVFFIS